MGVEIERKFLVADNSWLDGREGVRMAQGYLSKDPERTVRVRLAGDQAWITVKGRCEGIRRLEFEYQVPVGDAREMLKLCLPSIVEKTRYRVEYAGHVWEVDVFHGANAGLVLAEVELSDESVKPELPQWLGREVSDDPRFYNSSLSGNPYGRFS